MNRLTPVVFFLVLVAGCRPRVEPVEVDFRRLSLEEMKRGVLELELANPNGFGLAAESLRYFLVCGKDTVAQGTRQTPVSIPARDSVRAEFPFELRYGIVDIIARLPGILSDTAWLRLEGRYVFPRPVPSRPFSYSRAIPLAEEVRKITDGLKSLFGGD